MVPLFLRVYLSPDLDYSEVPVSPQTLCKDVVDVCREPGETDCFLLQSCADHERVVELEENMLELLQSWSPHKDVRYSLRHTQSHHMTSFGHEAGVDRAEEVQQTTEQETIQRLREKAQLHETKLQRIRAMRGPAESRRVRDVNTEEVQQITALFQMKQEELVVAAATVQRLTNQLQSLRSRRLDGQLKARLQRELHQVRTRNQDRGSSLDRYRDPDLAERRLNQLRQKLRNKKNQQRPQENQGPLFVPGSRVAAVGPYLQSLAQTLDSELRAPPRPAKPVPNPVSEVPPPLPARTNHRDQTREAPPPVPQRTNHCTERDRQFDSNMAAPPPLPRKSSSVSLFRSSTLPLPKHRAPPSAAVRPLTQAPPPAQATPPTLLRPQTVTAASICSLYTSGGSGAKYQPGHGTLPRSRPRAESKPSEFGFRCDVESVSVATHRDEEEEACRPRPLSPTKLLPFLSGGGGLRAGLLNAPRPLKKRSSVCEPDSAPQLLRVRYQRTAQTSEDRNGTAQTSEDRNGTAQTSEDHNRTAQTSEDNNGTAQTSQHQNRTTKTSEDHQKSAQSSEDHQRTAITIQDLQRTSQTSLNGTAEIFPKTEFFKAASPVSLTPPPLPPRAPIADSAHRYLQAPPTPTEQKTSHEKRSPQTKALKSVLRAPGSDRSGAGLRVWFNPVCLLLDSALEGEFDLVQRVIYEVSDPSAANDEGITALHNAVCAGHSDIVRFLVQFGVNVNAADSDGWTPLHCAASCNNTAVCQLLVQSGAAVFAQTHSDSQTPADKCEEQDPDYKECSQFLYGVQEKMGVMNRGQVFALWSFEPEEPDEVRVSEGDCVTVLDQAQRSDALWWRVRGGAGEGYIPRNLLGLYPRIKPRQRSLA